MIDFDGIEKIPSARADTRDKHSNEQIVQELECCTLAKTVYDCEQLRCPAYKGKGCRYFLEGETEGVPSLLVGDAIDLIRRQQAEIERLNKAVAYQKNEFERLRITMFPKVKAEAVREFAIRLLDHKYQSSDWSHGEHPFVVEVDDIDRVVGEMVGDTE